MARARFPERDSLDSSQSRALARHFPLLEKGPYMLRTLVLLAFISSSAFASDPAQLIDASPIVAGLKLGVGAQYSVTCADTSDVETRVEAGRTLYVTHIGCAADGTTVRLKLEGELFEDWASVDSIRIERETHPEE